MDKLDVLTDKVGDLGEAVGVLKEDVGVLKGTVGVLAGTVADLARVVGELKGSVGSLAEIQRQSLQLISSMSGRMDRMEVEIGQLKTYVSDIKNLLNGRR